MKPPEGHYPSTPLRGCRCEYCQTQRAKKNASYRKWYQHRKWCITQTVDIAVQTTVSGQMSLQRVLAEEVNAGSKYLFRGSDLPGQWMVGVMDSSLEFFRVPYLKGGYAIEEILEIYELPV